MPQSLVPTSAPQLQALAGDVALLQAVVDVIGHAPALVADIAAARTPEDVQAALTKAGLSAADQTALETALGGLLPAKYQPLFKPLSALAAAGGSIGWSVSAPAAPPVPTPYTFSLGATASLTLNPTDTWASDTADKQLLSITAKGQVDVSGGATIPWPPITTTVGASASADISIAFYFEPAMTDLFVVALAQSLGGLANPFDLGEVWAAFQRAPSLRGVGFGFDGAVSLQVQAALANMPALQVGNVAAIDFGATVSVKGSLDGKCTLSLTRGAGGAIQANLTRDRTAQADFSGSVGVTADLSQATKSVSAVLAAVAAKETSVLAKFEPYLTPGTWLRTQATTYFAQEVAKLTGDAGLQTALLADFQTALGGQAAGGLTDWLTTTLGSAIDNASALVNGNLDTGVANALGQLKQTAPNLASAAEAELEAWLKDALTQADNSLKSTLQQVFGSVGDELRQELQKVGVTVGGVFAAWDAALQPVRDLIAKADAQFHEYVAAAQAALKQTVTLQLTAEDKVTDEITVVVAGQFKGVDAAGRKLYGALTTGTLGAVIDVVNGKLSSPDFVLSPASSITRYAQIQESEGLAISFFGVTISWTQVITGEAHLTTDTLGNLHLDASASLDQTLNVLGVRKDASFVETAALMQAAGMAHAAATPPVLGAGVSASFAAGKLAKADVDRFVGQFIAAGLLSKEAAAAADAAFSKWAGSSATINGGLACNLRFVGPQIADLLQLSTRVAPSNRLSTDGARKIIGAAFDHILSLQPSSQGDYNIGKKVFLTTTSDVDASSKDVDVVFAAYGSLPDDNARPGGSEQPKGAPVAGSGDYSDYIAFFVDVYDIWQIVQMIELMGQIYLSTPGQPGWGQKDYAAKQATLAGYGQWWVNEYVAVTRWTDPRLAGSTIAFLQILSDLVAAPNKPSLTLSLTYQAASGPALTQAIV
jgi:hypothetical protein